LLGHIDLTASRCLVGDGFDDPIGARIHWVIAGGESGPGARPCDVAWIRSLINQCAEAGVACFVKQLGSVPMNGAFRQPPCREAHIDFGAKGHSRRFIDRKGGDPLEWPEDLRVRQMPAGASVPSKAGGKV
jgi:hypothetical protein